MTSFQYHKEQLEENPIWKLLQRDIKERLASAVDELIANSSDAIEKPGALIDLSAQIKIMREICDPRFLDRYNTKPERPE